MSANLHPDDGRLADSQNLSGAAEPLKAAPQFLKSDLDAIKPGVKLSEPKSPFMVPSVDVANIVHPSHEHSTAVSGIQPQGIRSRWSGSEPSSQPEKIADTKGKGSKQRVVFIIALVVLAPILAVTSAVMSDKRFANALQDPQLKAMLIHIIGKNFQSANQLGIAKYFYEESFKVNPTDTCCLIDIGLMKNQMDDLEGAKADYLKSITMQPQARAYNNLGTIYNDENNEDKAIAAFTKAIDLDPHWVLALDNRGSTYADQKKYDLALKDLNSAIKLGYARAYFSRYRTYAAMGRKELAERDNQIIQRHHYTDTTFCFMPPPPVSEQ